MAPRGAALAVDRVFARLGRDALWRQGGIGPGAPVRVIRRAPDRLASFGEGRFVADAVLLDVRVSEVAQLQRGDTFEIDGTIHELRSDPVRDSQRLVWAAEARAL